MLKSEKETSSNLGASVSASGSFSSSNFAEQAATRGDASQAVTCLTEPTEEMDEVFREWTVALVAGDVCFWAKAGASARTGTAFLGARGRTTSDDSVPVCLGGARDRGPQERDTVILFFPNGRHASVGNAGRGPLGGGPKGGNER